MFDKLFGRGKKKPENPEIPFGRYSDNNKTVEKVRRWTDADNLFKQQSYYESIDAFFDYLADNKEGNVILNRTNDSGTFQLFQGSKIVRGEFDKDSLKAEITLAKMPQPNVPVMRRLLEMNFTLYYSRYALDNDRLCMRFDSDIKTANPNKLYYGLKELAIKADKLDDLLVQEFAALQTVDTEHIIEIPQSEKDVKYDFMMLWIRETLDYAASLDADKFSGGIAYLLLSLAFRIDYLICPDGKLLNELEKIVEIYYRKDEKQTMERNQGMIEGYKKLLSKSKEEVHPYLFRSKHTFAIVVPQHHKTIVDAINAAAQNAVWYQDNNYPLIANNVMEYALSFSQYSYSLPKALSELVLLFMQINYRAYFEALGFTVPYYDAAANRFDPEAIRERIEQIVETWKAKYPKLQFRMDTLKFNSLVAFNSSFSTEITFLNFDSN
ncbi:YbjN domain-containing protein [Niastella caeni]|uniref:YbjN domain-containing protein n=1 Tax=Niastella caeni TaxID=2569763 RepID=A0A4S8I1N3_9BACT|nr:YbjN domain-containing protein [Niastella caeni]THU41910.1 YbjN domain-containing protein [Niastella caeni]